MSVNIAALPQEVRDVLENSFDKDFYLRSNPDVAKSQVAPFEHFINYGLNESRPWQVLSVAGQGKTIDLFETSKADFMSLLTETLKVSEQAIRLIINLLDNELDYDAYCREVKIELPHSFCSTYFLLNLGNALTSDLVYLQSDIKQVIEKLTGVNNPLEQLEIAANLNQKDGELALEGTFLGEKVAFFVGWETHNLDISDVKLVINGSEVEGKVNIIRFAREDVAKIHEDYKNANQPGFVAVVELTSTESAMMNQKNSRTTFKFCNFVSSKSADIENFIPLTRKCLPAFLSLIDFTSLDLKFAWSEIFAPVLDEIFAIGAKVNASVQEFGVSPNKPSVSLIIPLYGRFDFVQYQLSRFGVHGNLANAEIIYILDDPSIARQCLQFCQQVYASTGVNFKLVTMSRNMGFGRVNNIAAEIASSENLILLNSDILPIDSEWSGKLVEYLNQHENVGVVGARLLFEDGSIQHDGMVPMHLDAYPDLIFNDHPQKGWPLELAKNEAKLAECELVTAACVAVKKDTFLKVGGFDEQFYLGDFEDSDLCRKLLKTGHKNYIARDVVLNHLERQSQNLVEAGNWKHNLTIINAIHYKNRIDSEYSFLESN